MYCGGVEILKTAVLWGELKLYNVHMQVIVLAS